MHNTRAMGSKLSSIIILIAQINMHISDIVRYTPYKSLNVDWTYLCVFR